MKRGWQRDSADSDPVIGRAKCRAGSAVNRGAGGVEGGVPGGMLPQEPTVYKLGEGATTPELIHRPEPLYPPMARSSRVQGTVILSVLILTDGTVDDVKTLRGQPMGLTEAAIEAVRQWRYRPALLDGVAVPFQMTVLVHFKLGN